ncbi:nuclear transport factor 2 family protein [Sphingomonas naphthae]|uniref:Nuclear transport factor 2 family protein n=1 Tax=Sphingomonas naphthae TaxID=1813468 RepID=A0ABY7TMG7_9SPHN|nr:nuclear transport factor 2 family protein [Sphingomonas naphthae]WCT74432.1 nuclear transport factor 2 family protein [Sphingomonas naphthae]
MADTDRLAQLERKLQYLMDRSDILDCIARNARGCDRHDSDVLNSSYHADGTDEHGVVISAGDTYSDYANMVHAASCQQNLHNITTHSCEIDGDEAHAESYVIGLFLAPDGLTGRLIAGRYVDRLERRDGAWKIALRRSTVDVLLVGDASVVNEQFFKDMGYLKGMRDKTDASYQRPLTLEETPGDRW